MRVDLYTKCLLTAIVILLGVMALQPVKYSSAVSAAPSDYSYLYVEPRVTSIRRPDGGEQVQGEVFIDMRNGDIWGFPTLSGVPYPVNLTSPQPPVSAPMCLGKFDFSQMHK
jgi:hypothetical protein